MATVVYVQRLTGNGWENVYIGSILSVTGNTIDNVESYLHNLIDSAYENINVSGSNYATASQMFQVILLFILVETVIPALTKIMMDILR